MADNSEKLFTVKCSQKEFEYLQELFESGKLNEMLGVEVVDMGITATEHLTKCIILNQWLRGFVEPSWQVIKTLGDNYHLNFDSPKHNSLSRGHHYSSISCKKKYQLRSSIESHNLALIVQIETIKNQREIDVSVRVEPEKNQNFLPPGLKLILFIGSKVLAEVEARNADNAIQRQLTGDIGDNFSVKLELADGRIIEDFVI